MSTQPLRTEKLPEPANWYRGFVKGKTRIVLAWLGSIALVLAADQFPAWPGVLVCFLGATLRFWASGYLLKDQVVACQGPYAFTRNPLYLGTYIMAIGVAASIENIWLVLAVTFIFAAIYHFIILDEETSLRANFKKDFERYCVLVPRFFPRLWPASSEALREITQDHTPSQFSWSVALKNRAYEAYAAFIGLIGFVAIVAYLKNTLA